MLQKLSRNFLQMVVFLTCLQPQALWGHDSQERFIQHRFHVEVSPQNVDLHLELSFFGDRAIQERLRMDLDSDGRISLREERAYLRELASSIHHKIRMTLVGQPLPALLLFYPHLDLVDSRHVKPLPLKIEVSFFARTPSWFSPQTPLTVESEILTDQPAIRTVTANGKDGIEATADSVQNRVTEGDRSAFTFTIRCLKIERRARAARWTSSPVRP